MTDEINNFFGQTELVKIRTQPLIGAPLLPIGVASKSCLAPKIRSNKIKNYPCLDMPAEHHPKY